MSGQNQKTDKRRAWPIIIMNFTGVYDYEAFARNNKFIWLDCRHLYGTAVSYTHLTLPTNREV